MPPSPNRPAEEDSRAVPVWKGMTPEEQRAYIRDLCRIENERRRVKGESRKVVPVRPVYTGGCP